MRTQIICVSAHMFKNGRDTYSDNLYRQSYFKHISGPNFVDYKSVDGIRPVFTQKLKDWGDDFSDKIFRQNYFKHINAPTSYITNQPLIC